MVSIFIAPNYNKARNLGDRSMKNHFLKSLVVTIFIIFAIGLPPSHVIGEDKAHKDIRPSALAGTWYPGTRDALEKSVQGFLSKVKTPSPNGTLKAIIVPHAGHRYSGPVAAHAYKLLQERKFRRVILVGPSHRVAFSGVSVNLQAGYETPLGVVPVDQEAARKIMEADPAIRWIKKAHVIEHSLEIQLPFLQTVLRDVQIVPILMGQQDLKTCSLLANSLVQVLGDGKGTLLLASSDLSHFHPYSQAKTLDEKFIEHVQKLDPQGLAKDLSMKRCEACGGGPVIAVLMAAQKLGADRAEILRYANSGDVTGDHSRVVGYVAAALLRGK